MNDTNGNEEVTRLITSSSIQMSSQNTKVSVLCATGGDPAAGEGDRHLQTVLQELELNISSEDTEFI